MRDTAASTVGRGRGRLLGLALAATTVCAATSCAGQDSSAGPPVAAEEEATPHGIPGAWRAVFTDDFDGTALDEDKWSTGNPDEDGESDITGPVNTDEANCYDSGLVDVSEGSLRITAVEKRVSCAGRTFPYATGMINSRSQFTYVHGALEARIHLPAATPGVIANWPAFWQVGADWPADGEIDVMEGLSGKACFHFHSEDGEQGGCAPGDYTGWHTFGATWEPGRIDYYYDGALVGSVTRDVTSAPQWLVLNYSVQPSVGGPTRVPSDMRVDYVRVWQRN